MEGMDLSRKMNAQILDSTMLRVSLRLNLTIKIMDKESVPKLDLSRVSIALFLFLRLICVTKLSSFAMSNKLF